MAELRYLVVGGHARGIGKTALVEDVIRAFPEAGWTAVKISPHSHGAWPEQPAVADGAPAAVLEEETDRGRRTDSSRYLAAGAHRAFWLRVHPGRMADGMALLREAIAGTEYAILESNAVVDFVRPQLFLLVVDPSQAEFKESARRPLGRVDGVVARNPLNAAAWDTAVEGVIRSKPIFEQRMGEPLPPGLVSLIRQRLFTAMHPGTPSEHLPG